MLSKHENIKNEAIEWLVFLSMLTHTEIGTCQEAMGNI